MQRLYNYLNFKYSLKKQTMRLYLISLILLCCSCSEVVDTPSEITEIPSAIVEEETVPMVMEEVKKNEVEEPIQILDTIVEVKEDVVVENPDSEEYKELDWSDYEAAMTKDYSYVIILSTKKYSAALNRAREAAEKLDYPLDLRGLHENEETGLSVSKEVCAGICGGANVPYPLYLSRSHHGDSKYVSVEYSDGYKGFAKGYYIVVIASGQKGNPAIQEVLTEARKFYKDAYAKTCGVYMGCGC